MYIVNANFKLNKEQKTNAIVYMLNKAFDSEEHGTNIDFAGLTIAKKDNKYKFVFMATSKSYPGYEGTRTYNHNFEIECTKKEADKIFNCDYVEIGINKIIKAIDEYKITPKTQLWELCDYKIDRLSDFIEHNNQLEELQKTLKDALENSHSDTLDISIDNTAFKNIHGSLYFRANGSMVALKLTMEPHRIVVGKGETKYFEE